LVTATVAGSGFAAADVDGRSTKTLLFPVVPALPLASAAVVAVVSTSSFSSLIWIGCSWPICCCCFGFFFCSPSSDSDRPSSFPLRFLPIADLLSPEQIVSVVLLKSVTGDCANYCSHPD
jgi:hypothetical protein